MMVLTEPNRDGTFRNQHDLKTTIDQRESWCPSLIGDTSAGSTSFIKAQHSSSQRLQNMLKEFSFASLMHNDASSRIQNIFNLVDCCPEVVSARNKNGLLPIHIACQEGVPLAIVERLVKAGPDTVLSATNDRRCMLPLHLACRYFNGSNRDKTQIIRYLSKLSPTTIHLTTADGETALHLICRNYFCTVKDIRFLYRLFPAALTFQCLEGGKTPLHIACEKKYMERKGKNPNGLLDEYPSSSSTAIIHYLIKKQPSVLRISDTRGHLPLHSAVRGSQPTPLLLYMLRRFPFAATETNLQGRTPLHLATLQPIPSLNTIEELHRANRTAATMKDNRGDEPKLAELGITVSQ